MLWGFAVKGETRGRAEQVPRPGARDTTHSLRNPKKRSQQEEGKGRGEREVRRPRESLKVDDRDVGGDSEDDGGDGPFRGQTSPSIATNLDKGRDEDVRMKVKNRKEEDGLKTNLEIGGMGRVGVGGKRTNAGNGVSCFQADASQTSHLHFCFQISNSDLPSTFSHSRPKWGQSLSLEEGFVRMGHEHVVALSLTSSLLLFAPESGLHRARWRLVHAREQVALLDEVGDDLDLSHTQNQTYTRRKS